MTATRSVTFPDALKSDLGLRMRGDGPPHWREGRNNNPPVSASDARRARRLLVKTLDHHRHDHAAGIDVMRRLDACGPTSPCGSGACPVCWRAMRRLLVHATRHLFREDGQYAYVSCICAPEMVAQGQLHTVDPLGAVERRLMTIAASRSVRILGGLDLSANEHEHHRFERHLMPHAHHLVAARAFDRHRDAWEGHFPRHHLVTMPIKAPSYDGRRRAIAYSLHPISERRVSLMPHVAAGGTRVRANTRDKPLRRPQRLELALMLDRVGIEARIITYGYELLTDGRDIWMVQVDRERATELLAERRQRRAMHREQHLRRDRERELRLKAIRFSL